MGPKSDARLATGLKVGLGTAAAGLGAVAAANYATRKSNAMTVLRKAYAMALRDRAIKMASNNHDGANINKGTLDPIPDDAGVWSKKALNEKKGGEHRTKMGQPMKKGWGGNNDDVLKKIDQRAGESFEGISGDAKVQRVMLAEIFTPPNQNGILDSEKVAGEILGGFMKNFSVTAYGQPMFVGVSNALKGIFSNAYIILSEVIDEEDKKDKKWNLKEIYDEVEKKVSDADDEEKAKYVEKRDAFRDFMVEATRDLMKQGGVDNPNFISNVDRTNWWNAFFKDSSDISLSTSEEPKAEQRRRKARSRRTSRRPARSRRASKRRSARRSRGSSRRRMRSRSSLRKSLARQRARVRRSRK